MIRTVVTSAALALTLGLVSGHSLASDEAQASDTATVVFYREGDTSRTRQLNFHTFADGEQLGRLKANSPVAAQVEAGEATLRTSIPDSERLDITLQPGQTYYVRTVVEKLGNKVISKLQLVEEQVALSAESLKGAAI